MRKALCCIGFLCSVTLPLAGQDNSSGEQSRKLGRSAWFACISELPEGLENPVKVMSGKDITELEITQYMTSGPVKIQDDGVISIVRESPDPANPGKTKYQALGMAKIPDGVLEALVILAPLEKPEDGLLFRVKVQNLASFKGGDRLFINLSDTNIGIKIGETSVAVPARQSNIYNSPKLTESANMPIIYSYYHPEQERWKLLTATTVVIMPTRREICVFNNGNRTGKVKRHGILFPVQMESP